MERKRIFLILVGIVFVSVLGFFVYKIIVSQKQANLINITELTDNGFSSQLGDKKLAFEYVDDPSSVNYGVPIYPNAKPNSNQESSADFELNQTKFTVGSFQTSDSTSKVISFYKSQFGSSAISSDYTNGGIKYNLVTTQDSSTPVVSVFTKENKTNFMIIKK